VVGVLAEGHPINISMRAMSADVSTRRSARVTVVINVGEPVCISNAILFVPIGGVEIKRPR
jgi:hypothetical protein